MTPSEILKARTDLLLTIRQAVEALAVSFQDRNKYSTCFAGLARIDVELATLHESAVQIANEKN